MPIDKKSDRFQRGLKTEMKEHPWIPKWGAEKLVTDHIRENPRGAYPVKRKK